MEFRASEKARRGIKATLLNLFGTSVLALFSLFPFRQFSSLYAGTVEPNALAHQRFPYINRTI